MSAFLNATPLSTFSKSFYGNGSGGKDGGSAMSSSRCPFLRMCPFMRGRVAPPHPPVDEDARKRGGVSPRMDVEQDVVGVKGKKNKEEGNREEEESKKGLFSGNGGVFSVDPKKVQDDNEENLRGFIKTRGSLIPGEEFVYWWTGDIFGMGDEGSSKHLFAFEGYNIGRMMRVDGGWRMLTREVGLYKDAKTREILGSSWKNVITGKENEVVHVWNDPVNQQFLLEGPRGKFKVPTTDGGDDLYFHAEVFLKYPSPLPKSMFPERAGSEDYQSAEMFQFFTKKEDLLKDEPSADCQISWVRVGQWLPWMEMGDKPGKMVYHCRGKKLKNGYKELSPQVRAFIEKEHPEYAEAPSNFTAPNETSWTYFRKLLDAKGTPRADGRIAGPEPKSDIPAPSVVHLTDNSKVEEEAPIMKEFTEAELSSYNGRDSKKPIYLSVAGSIFDVSSARRHYRVGESYNCLAGRDATGAFIEGTLSDEVMKKFSTSAVQESLSDEQQNNLENWLDFFKQKYPVVGTLITEEEKAEAARK